MKQTNWRLLLKTFAFSLLGAILFYFFYIPVPWLLGPLVIILFFQMAFKQSFQWHSKLQQTGLVVIGYMLGSSFTLDTGQQMILYLPSMLLVTIGSVLFSLMLGYLVALGSGIGVSTSIFGSIPGGLSQMIALSEEFEETETTIVTIMQLTRILMVIFLVPLWVHFGMANRTNRIPESVEAEILNASLPWYSYLIILVALWLGTWAAVRIKFPTPYLTGPLFVTVLLILLGIPIPELPKVILIAGQVLFSTHLAVHMNITGLKKYQNKFLWLSLLANILLLLFALILAWLLTKWQSFTYVTAFLSTAPGGIDVMGITAKEVGANLPVITAFQVFRMFFIILVVPPLLRLALKRKVSKKE